MTTLVPMADCAVWHISVIVQSLWEWEKQEVSVDEC